VSAAEATPVTVAIRPAVAGDAGAIAEIYNREVLESTATFDLVPRTLEQQRDWLAARSGAFAAIVAVEPESRRVIGFASLSPYKERAAYRTTVEDSIYVHADFARRGVGRALLTRLVEIARESGFHAVMARIEAGGDGSRALHASLGFELVGIEREVGRKFNRWLSVASMQLLL
jgi:phosphinothricin acetyltransferase